MAKIEILAPFILSWEGGYNKTPGDRGGATNKGVTLATWRRHGYDKDGDDDIDERDVMMITEYDAIYEIMKPVYWDRWKADRIESQAIANIVVDWYWNSGAYGIKLPQKVLGVEMDGVVGEKTLAALNNHPNRQRLFDMLWQERRAFFCRLAINPTQRRFLSGWLNRLCCIQEDRLICNDKKHTVIGWEEKYE
jgi:lysozyme family protein